MQSGDIRAAVNSSHHCWHPWCGPLFQRWVTQPVPVLPHYHRQSHIHAAGCFGACLCASKVRQESFATIMCPTSIPAIIACTACTTCHALPSHQQKRKQTFVLFSDHNGNLLRSFTSGAAFDALCSFCSTALMLSRGPWHDALVIAPSFELLPAKRASKLAELYTDIHLAEIDRA